MVDRGHKPTKIGTAVATAPKDEAWVQETDTGHKRVEAGLPSGERIEVLLWGATVISWKDGQGKDKLWLSQAAKLDGSKPIRGGIPVVFPVFGHDADNTITNKLPQHGFARTSEWEYLGSTKTSEDDSVKKSVRLDFGLSSATADPALKDKWGYDYSLIYSVLLTESNLTTSITITNKSESVMPFQVLMHTYLAVDDITKVSVDGLDGVEYLDKLDSATIKQQKDQVSIQGETDRVYYQPKRQDGSSAPLHVLEDGKKRLFKLERQGLNEVVVWNPWVAKAAAFADFEPKDGYTKMLCVEAGAVKGFIELDAGDTYEASQTIWDCKTGHS